MDKMKEKCRNVEQNISHIFHSVKDVRYITSKPELNINPHRMDFEQFAWFCRNYYVAVAMDKAKLDDNI